MKQCQIFYNTKYGYVLQPISFKSISDALKDAKEKGMAYRIFVGNQCVRHGWYC